MDMFQDNAEEDSEFTDWPDIVNAIKRNKCCLLLGPELISIKIHERNPESGKKDYIKISVQDAFCRWLDEQLPAYKFLTNVYFKSNKLIRQKYEGKHFEFKNEIEAFKHQRLTDSTSIYRLLAKIPFNSIVNVVPDSFIAKSRKHEGFCFVEDYYNYRADERSNIEGLTDDVQLIYNLFGSYDDPASVPYTEKDELLLIKNITSRKPKIPDNVRTRFNDPEKSFLFLGFNFNEWYFRLVIDALDIPRPNLSVSPRVKSDHNVGFLTREYYTEQYAFGFIKNSTESFLVNLLRNYGRESVLSRKLNVVLDYHPHDLKYSELLIEHLVLNGFTKRAILWDRSEITNGAIEPQVDEKLDEADVCITFVGTNYLIEEKLRNRLVRVLDQQYTRTITIQTNYYETRILDLSKAFKQLPLDKVPLGSSKDDDLNTRCYKLAEHINCIIR